MTDTTDRDIIRVRFAPSPTGYLHVGGARTALFNWLFCRRHGGRFILRIEDTDIQRNIAGAERKLMDDLRWLGLDWDEGPDIGGGHGPYRQSERRDAYEEAKRKLLDEGNAYYALDTPEELDALRRQAAAQKHSFRYPRPDPLPTAAEAERARADGRPVVVRFKAPHEPITVHDEILGDVRFGAGEVEDLVIVKSNGWPTYHFAVVVDDAMMDITHVLRAQEHLMNTPKHVFLQRALGCQTPKFAHLPLVFNTDGSKMSKRDKHKAVRTATGQRIKQKMWTVEQAAGCAEASVDAVERWLAGADTELDMARVALIAAVVGVTIPEIDVHDFRASGYLPEALVNFLCLLGWSPGDDRERFSREEAAAAFSIERIIKSNARFDRDKLLATNTDWCAAAAPRRLLDAFKDWAQVSASPLAALDDDTVARVLAACKGFRTFPDVAYKAGILFAPDEQVQYDPEPGMDARAVKDIKAGKKVLQKKGGAGYAMLERLQPEFAAIEPWTVDALEAFFADFSERTGVKLGDVAQPVRVAVAGRPVSPAIADTLVLLGKEKTLHRIRVCLSRRRNDD